MYIYIHIYLVCVFVGARTLRSLVVLAPCAWVDFIILFQLADLGPGLGLGGLSHFLGGGCSRVSVARRAHAVGLVNLVSIPAESDDIVTQVDGSHFSRLASVSGST